MIMRLPQRFALIPILLLAVFSAILFASGTWQRRMDFCREGALIDDSAMSRFNAWRYSCNLALDYPLTGGGFEAFTPELFNRYAPNPADVHGPHSIYFGVPAEHGFRGLFLYLSVLACTLLSLQMALGYGRRWGMSLRRLMRRYYSSAFMICGSFLGRAYFDYYFTIVACTAIARRLATTEQRAFGGEHEFALGATA